MFDNEIIIVSRFGADTHYYVFIVNEHSLRCNVM